MKHTHTMIAAGGFAFVIATAMGTDVNRAEADTDTASNSHLKGNTPEHFRAGAWWR
jgi:hypothetical protein